MNLLLDVIGDLRSLVDSLQTIADAAEDDGTAEAEMTVTKKPEETGKAGKTGKAAKNMAKKDAKPAKQELEEKPLTLEEVRTVLEEKSRSGHTEKVRELFAKYGADKLSEIDTAEYPVLLALRKRRCCDGETRFFYNEEMEECACAYGYAEYVLSLVEEAKRTCKDLVVLIEQRLDFSRFVEEGFGTWRLRDYRRRDAVYHRLQAWQGRGGFRQEEPTDDAVCPRLTGTV